MDIVGKGKAEDDVPPGNRGAAGDKPPDPDKKERVFKRTVKGTDEMARYVTNDLEELVELTHVNLSDELQIPLEYYHRQEDIIALLMDDLSRMLRDELITGIHILLRDRNFDIGSGAYPVRYHVHYTIGQPDSQAVNGGGLISQTRNTLLNARFALLVDWNRIQGSKIKRLGRPEYNFDWVPEAARFKSSNTQPYRTSGIMVDGVHVKRVEKR